MMPEIELHPMTEMEFADYRVVALADNREDLPTGSWRTRDEAQTRFAAAFNDGLQTVGIACYAIRTATATVGFMICQEARRSATRECFILDFHILPAFRRQSYATASIRQLREIATSLGYDQIGLSVLPNNEAAERLYCRCGFEPAFTRFQLPLRP